MKVLGLDVSSSSTGIALVEGEEILDQAVWTPPKGKPTRGAALLDYYVELDDWLELALKMPGIDMAVVEEPGGGRLGFHAVRTMAHFEGVTLFALERHQIPVRSLKATQIRHLALGIAVGATKAEVHVIARQRYPKLKLPAVNRGGEDVLDAFLAALAGPKALLKQ